LRVLPELQLIDHCQFNAVGNDFADRVSRKVAKAQRIPQITAEPIVEQHFAWILPLRLGAFA
jgi:hypothetical protein